MACTRARDVGVDQKTKPKLAALSAIRVHSRHTTIPSHISLLSSRLCCLEKQEDCLLSRDLGYFGVGEL